MEAVCNLGNWLIGADQHHFGTLHPDIFDVGADGYTHFLLKLSGQVIFRISHLSGEGGESQLLFCVQFDIVPAAADLGGNVGIGPVFADPENEILKHGQGQRSKVRMRFALGHAVDITVTDCIGGIRGDSRLNGFADAQVDKGGGDNDSLLQGLPVPRVLGIEQMVCLCDCIFVVDISFPENPQKSLLCKIYLGPVVFRRF